MSNQNHPSFPPAGSGGFIQHLHEQGKSGLFLAAIILFTAGNVFAQFMVFSAFSILSLLFVALPIVGFWLIFAASKNPTLPEKSLTALTLFKVYTIISLVFIALAALIVIAATVISIIFANEFFGDLSLFLMVIAPLFIAVIIIYIAIFYCVCILRILKSIRENIVNNTMNPLRGVTPFSIITILMVSFGILASFISLAIMGIMTPLINDLLDEIAHAIALLPQGQAVFINMMDIESMLRNLLSTMTFTVLFGVLTQIGTILLVVSLNRLASSIKR